MANLNIYPISGGPYSGLKFTNNYINKSGTFTFYLTSKSSNASYSTFYVYYYTNPNDTSTKTIIDSWGGGWISIGWHTVVVTELAINNGIYIGVDGSASFPVPSTGDNGPYVTVQHDDATIVNFTSIGSNAQAPISFSWQSTYNTTYNLQAYQNDILVYEYTGESQTSHSISANTLNTGSIKFKCRTGNTFNGGILWSEFQEQTINVGRNEPTIVNLNSIGEYWEAPIEINWRSDYQEGWQSELYQNNILIDTINGTTLKAFTIAATTFANKDNVSVRVRSFNTYLGVIAYSSWSEISLNLKDITPSVSNLALSGSNVDLQLTLSWASLYQQGFEVLILKNDAIIETYTGTLEKEVVIAASTLDTGLYTLKVRVSYKTLWTDYILINANLIETLPSIGVLEPDGTMVDRDEPIRVWWTSNNQLEWNLSIDNDTVSYNGTYQNEQIILPGDLQTGKHKIHLIVTYITSSGLRKVVSKNAEFIVQGKPPVPTITSANTFDTSRPTITWDTQEQQGYIMDILKENEILYTTEWQNGLITRQKILNYLENGIYTIRIKIINQYGIESDYGVKTVTINTTEITSITLATAIQGNTVRLDWNNTNLTFLIFYIIRNGIVIAKTTDTAYVDHAAHGESNYIVRGVNSDDVYIDSNISSCVVIINHGVVATIDKFSELFMVGLSRDSYTFGGNIELENTIIHCTGRELPITIFGEHMNSTYSLSFSKKDTILKFIKMCQLRQVFLYRDRNQKLFVTIPSPNYTIDKTGIVFNIQAIEVDYKEGIDYD